ncbi:alpha-(1-_6)-mannopyranosyltransferase A [Corynebacterium sp. CCM 9187]|uniref:Alpha-(1->6)-mannopyranosyltransferase A n=1 Tax=Corynebacterium pygosceleis TaxID=2800406 RepID=A0ABT3WQQ2_9CORY|nr:alpha-(1->6)-mannopyranosyltransferase A [Corynebacterium pygosceleis]MCK7675208.1 alpha-(1->6)-mannopyranosyltransferase A [Corynebacterium pygosceleis]MCL0120577.1 alpha-(1->6)-mannopyranosyltransferase A [Corynebacterium pygosceleis]MCX7444128.1 alpha-(1->6)-mannopyranosyltransferase A [Corynebacterium pygosceleis]
MTVQLLRPLDRLADRHPDARAIGATAAIVITLASFGGGAIRYRGGVLDALGLSFLSYGHGAAVSNVSMWLGLALMTLAWLVLGRGVLRGRVGAREVTRSLVWWVSPLVLAAPILSRDVYSYLMQGAMVRDGFDPYSQGAAVNPGPMLLEVSHDWRNTTTPYGPLHLWLGDAVTGVAGDSVTLGVFLYKLISLVGFWGIVWCVPRIATRINGDGGLALWLGVANPVTVLHLIGGMHNESVMVALVSLGILLALDGRFTAAMALVAVSVAFKATAIIALPFLVWMMHRHLLRRGLPLGPVGAFLAAGSWSAATTFIVVTGCTWLSGAGWGWVAQLSGNSKVINPLALPSLVAGIVTPLFGVTGSGVSYNAVLVVTRQMGMIGMLIGLIVAWWVFRHDDRRNIMGIAAAYTVVVTLNAVTLPWYYVSLIVLVGTFSPSRRIVGFTVWCSVVVAMSFTGSGNHQMYNLVWMGVLAVVAWYLTGWLSRSVADAPSGRTVPPTPGAVGTLRDRRPAPGA